MEKPTHHGGCYGDILSFRLIAAILLCLLLQPSTAQPEVTIEKFTITTLNEVANSSNTINFDIKFGNYDPYPIDYNTLNLTFYYKPNNTILPIGNVTFKPFYLSKIRSTHRVGTIEDGASNFGSNVTMTESPPVVFRVELATSIKYEFNIIFKSKWQRYVVGADLKVDGQGNLIKGKHNRGIPLTLSGVGRNHVNHFQLVAMMFISFFFFHSL